MNNTLIYVDLKASRRGWPTRRPQKWYWTALNGDNHRVLATSSESYTNRADCIAAIYALFGVASNVFLRQNEIGNVTLRQAVTE